MPVLVVSPSDGTAVAVVAAAAASVGTSLGTSVVAAAAAVVVAVVVVVVVAVVLSMPVWAVVPSVGASVVLAVAAVVAAAVVAVRVTAHAHGCSRSGGRACSSHRGANTACRRYACRSSRRRWWHRCPAARPHDDRRVSAVSAVMAHYHHPSSFSSPFDRPRRGDTRMRGDYNDTVLLRV